MDEQLLPNDVSPWYKIVSSSYTPEQGDILMDFPVVDVTLDAYHAIMGNGDYELNVQKFNMIIVTQSCDLEDADNADLVILCPMFSWLDIVQFENLESKGKRKDRWGKLVRGQKVGEHIINRCDLEAHEFDYQVIDFRRLYTVPYEVIKDFLANTPERIRLMPPYREHMSQAFANVFMRIGLPSNLPSQPPQD